MQSSIDILTLRKSVGKWHEELRQTIEQETLKQATDNLTIKVSLAENMLSKPIPIELKVENANTNVQKVEYKGNQYELDMFKKKIQFIDYKKHNAKNKKVLPTVNRVSHVCETTEELEQQLAKKDIKKTWSRLDMFSKKQKIREFLHRQIMEGTLKGPADTYFPTLEKMVQEKKLTKKSDVEYDVETGTITQITSMASIFSLDQ